MGFVPPISLLRAPPYAATAYAELERKLEHDMHIKSQGRFDPAIDPKVMTREHLIGMLRTTARLYLYDHHSPIITVPVRSPEAAVFLSATIGGGTKATNPIGTHHPYQWGIWGQPLLDLVADLAGDLVAMYRAIMDKYPYPDEIAEMPAPIWWEVETNNPYNPPPAYSPLSDPAATLIAGARAMASIPDDPSLPPHWNAMLASMRKAVAEFDATP